MPRIHRTVDLPFERVSLEADFDIPEVSRGVVLFAHGSGSSRLSPRNQLVARVLHDAGLATVLVDLLTTREEQLDRRTGELRFNIVLLAARVIALTDWVAAHEPTAGLDIGLFGASTGAAAALVAAAARPSEVMAVVSRGGRPDLAGADLAAVHQPTLLLVGERDQEVIELNRRALELLPGTKRLEIIPGATHLFEEPGTLERVADLARDWFTRYLGSR
jgi:putative phosphoribosyl transferase